MTPVQGLAGIGIERRDSERLGMNGVGAEHEIETTADVEGLAFRYHRSLEIEIELVQLKAIGAVRKRNGAVETVGRITRVIRRSEINPSSHSNPGIFEYIWQLNGMKISRHRTQQQTRCRD